MTGKGMFTLLTPLLSKAVSIFKKSKKKRIFSLLYPLNLRKRGGATIICSDIKPNDGIGHSLNCHKAFESQQCSGSCESPRLFDTNLLAYLTESFFFQMEKFNTRKVIKKFRAPAEN